MVSVLFAFPDEPLGEDSLPSNECVSVTIWVEVTVTVIFTTFGGSAGMELPTAGGGGDDDRTGAAV
jgi:hypothetical protein